MIDSHLATVLSIMAEAVVSVDASLRIVFFNEGARTIFGYEPAEVIGRPLDILLPGAHHVVSRSSVTARKVGERMEVRALRSTGEEFDAEASIVRTEGPDGPSLTVVLRDVTERRRAREGLARSERQLAEVQRIARLGSWEWDVEQDTITWSEELYRIFGLEPGTPIDFEGFIQRIYPEDQQLLRDTVGRAFETGEAFDVQHRIVRPDGELRWVHGRGRLTRDARGHPVRMAGTGHDITEAREAEHSSRQLAVEAAARSAAEDAERRMRFLARASVELASSLEYEVTLATVARLAVPTLADWCAVDVVDEEGIIRRLAVEHQDPEKVDLVLRIETQYPSDPQATYGVPQVVRTGRSEWAREIPDELLVDVATDERHLELLRELGLESYIVAPLVARGQTLGALTMVQAESGRLYDEADKALVEDLAGRAAMAIDNARLMRELEDAQVDLEDQAGTLEAQSEELEIQNEELLAQSEELESALQARSDFMATVSHELRTPLNAIIGYAELLTDGVPVPIPPPSVDHARRVSLAAKHLLQLIDEILTFSRLEADREVVEIDRLDPADLVQEVEAMIGPLAEAQGLAFRVDVGELPAQVSTDSRKLRQILINLLGNAVKFTDEGWVELRISEIGGRLALEVADTGCGISGEERGKLFEPFWQAERSRVRRLGGTGLGLAISARYARLLGGEITVDSTPGKGSTFRLELPVASPVSGA